MKAQKLYEKSTLHLLRQGKKSVSKQNGSCAYRSNFEASCPWRCAVGAIIPDKAYEPSMEHYPDVKTLTKRFPEVAFLAEHAELGRRLTIDDFTDAPINEPIRFGFRMGVTCAVHEG